VYVGESSEEKRVTALLTLGEIACVSVENEQRILMELSKAAAGINQEKMLELGAREEEKEKEKGKGKEKGKEKEHEDSMVPGSRRRGDDLVTFIMEHIARALSYQSPKALVESHLSFLLKEWCEQKYPLNEFPIHLLHETNFVEFLKNYDKVLLPKLVFLMDRKNIQSIADLIPGATASKLIIEHFSSIFAHTFPLYYTRGRNGKYGKEKDLGIQICEKFLPPYLGSNSIDSLIPKELDDILIHLLELVRFRKNVDEVISGSSGPANGDDDDGSDELEIKPPNYLPQTVEQVFDHLAQGFQKSKAVELFFKTKDRVQKILLHINQRLAQSHRKEVIISSFICYL